MAAAQKHYKNPKQNVVVKKTKILQSIALKLLKQGRSVSQVVYLTNLPYDDVTILKRKIVNIE